MFDPDTRRLRPWLWLAALAIPLCGLAVDPVRVEPVRVDTVREVTFDRDVRPILSEYCFHCHGPDAKSRKAELRLDTKQGLFAVRDGKAAFVPGKPDQSEALRRIAAHDKDRMPPRSTKRELTAKQRATLRAWVEQGAKWEQHWAFVAPQRPALPAVADTPHPIDRFVRARLAAKGLPPSPPADRRRLLRRVTLDLTGLPPTPEEIAAFVRDNSPKAYEKVVDRLLASRRYAERMAWDWLEAARYADTNGYQGDNTRTMWPYRDWVVDAMHRNLPYDDFVVWQLAGDLLPDATFEQQLATAFCRNHMINGEGGRIAEENRVEYVFDQIETMGTLWLGMTVTCARCHDHKFDPLTQRNYYELFAYFNQTPVTGAGGNPQTAPTLTVRTPVQTKELAARTALVADLERRTKQLGDRIVAAGGQPAFEKREAARLGGGAFDSLRPLEAKSQRGQTMKIRPDRAVLVSGANPAKDVYHLEYALPQGTHTGLLLDALRHPSMTAGGLARSNSGNFVLTGIGVRVKSGGTTRDVPIAAAEATYEQGDYRVRGAFDGKSNTGWAVYRGRPVQRAHAAAFRFAHPVQVDAASRLLVTLRFESRHAKHNLGHFRISTTAAPEPRLPGAGRDLARALTTPAVQRSTKQREQVRAAFLRTDATYRELETQRDAAHKALAAYRKQSEKIKVMVMRDRAERRKTYMLERGSYRDRRDVVEAALPAFLAPKMSGQAKDRLALARWLVHPEHPLTARVTVNRHWQKFFGRGLVKTVEDFGAQGSKPTHPQLLDWLAREFVDGGWDVKALHRRIVTSATYRQSAKVTPAALAKDPDNLWLARGPRHRLPSWMIRDVALAVSGLLVDEAGGPPVKPYQPKGIWSEATFGKKKYVQDHGDKLYRRSLYTFWRRIIGPTVFFDVAKRQTCTVGVTLTNTPLHALTTLNGTIYVEAARALAQRALRQRRGVGWVFELVTSRKPTAPEKAILLQRLGKLRMHYRHDIEAAEELLSVGESARDDSIGVAEHAAWTGLCSLLLNLDEALNK